MSIILRPLRQEDIAALDTAFLAQGWPSRAELFERYLKEVSRGERQVMVAELDGQPAGYVTLVPRSPAGPFAIFAGKDIPEIVDFNVLECFQRRGVGKALLDEIERLAAQLCDQVCIGVGLHAGYGAAQRMYVKRGFIPDGSGVWYGGKPVTPYEKEYPIDDELALYFSKKL